jgi:hypothetical protein
MAKTAGAIFLTDSVVTPLDEETTASKTGNKKMKYGFEVESKYANRVYLLIAPDDKTRKVCSLFPHNTFNICKSFSFYCEVSNDSLF